MSQTREYPDPVLDAALAAFYEVPNPQRGWDEVARADMDRAMRAAQRVMAAGVPADAIPEASA